MYIKNMISIIVPVYKVENYLCKCVDSIIEQTYKLIEIILVDDGSPDKSGIICDKYASKDNRIKVIHKENGGLSDARNVGIDNSLGEYIMFVDSDDYIAPNMCEILLKNAISCKADIVSCNFNNIYINKAIKRNHQFCQKNKLIYTNKEIIYNLFFHYTIDLNVVWNKLYKRDFFFGNINIRFPYGKLHEDDYTIYKFYYYAKKIVILEDSLYYYLQRKGSITSNLSTKNIIDKIDGLIEQYNFANLIQDKDFKYMVQVNSINLYYYWYKSYKNNNIIKQKLKEYRIKIINNSKDIYLNPYMNWKKYIKYFFMKLKLIDFCF